MNTPQLRLYKASFLWLLLPTFHWLSRTLPPNPPHPWFPEPNFLSLPKLIAGSIFFSLIPSLLFLLFILYNLSISLTTISSLIFHSFDLNICFFGCWGCFLFLILFEGHVVDYFVLIRSSEKKKREISRSQYWSCFSLILWSCFSWFCGNIEVKAPPLP